MLNLTNASFKRHAETEKGSYKGGFFRLCSALMLLGMLASACSCVPAVEDPVTDAPLTIVATKQPLPSPAPVKTPAECINELRLIKNDFFNRLDSAFTENANISGYLYYFTDFVYGDRLLMPLVELGGDPSELGESAELAGLLNEYLDMNEPQFDARSEEELIIDGVLSDGQSARLTVRRDIACHAFSIMLFIGGDFDSMLEFIVTEAGAFIQYKELYGETVLGYRSYIRQDLDGTIAAGEFSGQSSIFDTEFAEGEENLTEGLNEGYRLITLDSGLLTIHADGGDITHLIGDTNGDGRVDESDAITPIPMEEDEI